MHNMQTIKTLSLYNLSVNRVNVNQKTLLSLKQIEPKSSVKVNNHKVLTSYIKWTNRKKQ